MKNKIHPFVMESDWSRRFSLEDASKYGLDKCGWGNGYVKIPPGHPWYGMNYNDIEIKWNIDIHGGLTYSGWAMVGFGTKTEEEAKNKDWWIVGFDTRHFSDTASNWSDVHVIHEAIKLAKQAEKTWNDKIEEI